MIMRDAVSIQIDASPQRVWELVSDITNTGRFSPETIAAEWLDGATGPAVGVRFRGLVKRNGRGPTYWSTCRIIACEPGREFAFVVGVGDSALNTWRYVFEPHACGTRVTESFELTNRLGLRIYWALLGRLRGRTNRHGMQTTLQRIKAEAESSSDPAQA
jgi:hypothetical protein